MLWYPVHRQRFPSSSARIVFSSAPGWRPTRSMALITMPGVQKPHCRPWQSRNASCIGCILPSAAARPSIVRTVAPCACAASTLHAFTALPSRWTVHAPHWAVSHPTWVPVRPRFTRMKSTRSVRGSTSAVTGLPLTTREMEVPIADLLCVIWEVSGGEAKRCRSGRWYSRSRGNWTSRSAPFRGRRRLEPARLGDHLRPLRVAEVVRRHDLHAMLVEDVEQVRVQAAGRFHARGGVPLDALRCEPVLDVEVGERRLEDARRGFGDDAGRALDRLLHYRVHLAPGRVVADRHRGVHDEARLRAGGGVARDVREREAVGQRHLVAQARAHPRGEEAEL